MISGGYDINAFIGQVEDKPYEDVILLAQDEATAAERVCLRNRSSILDADSAPYTYACQLKDVIQYLRYGTISPTIKNNHIDSLVKVRDAYFNHHNTKPH
jgi:hypothetical protein